MEVEIKACEAKCSKSGCFIAAAKYGYKIPHIMKNRRLCGLVCELIFL